MFFRWSSEPQLGGRYLGEGSTRNFPSKQVNNVEKGTKAMRKRTFSKPVLILIVASITLVYIFSGFCYSKEKYQYKVIHVPRDAGNIESLLSSLSAEGWELVSYNNDIVILKKEAEEVGQLSPQTKLRCPKCGAIFTVEVANFELQSTGIKNPEKGKCPKCGAVFSKADSILK